MLGHASITTIGHNHHFTCSSTLRCSHTPLKTHKIGHEELNQNYVWIEDATLHIHAKFYVEQNYVQ
jgi:hypothetical protein